MVLSFPFWSIICVNCLIHPQFSFLCVYVFWVCVCACACVCTHIGIMEVRGHHYVSSSVTLHLSSWDLVCLCLRSSSVMLHHWPESSVYLHVSTSSVLPAMCHCLTNTWMMGMQTRFFILSPSLPPLFMKIGEGQDTTFLLSKSMT